MLESWAKFLKVVYDPAGCYFDRLSRGDGRIHLCYGLKLKLLPSRAEYFTQIISLISRALYLQHYVSMFFANLTIPLVLGGAICMGEDNVGKSELIGTLFVLSGIITLAQNLIGCRSVVTSTCNQRFWL